MGVYRVCWEKLRCANSPSDNCVLVQTPGPYWILCGMFKEWICP